MDEQSVIKKHKGGLWQISAMQIRELLKVIPAETIGCSVLTESSVAEKHPKPNCKKYGKRRFLFPVFQLHSPNPSRCGQQVRQAHVEFYRERFAEIKAFFDQAMAEETISCSFRILAMGHFISGYGYDGIAAGRQ
ncbi:MAG: hypothetical protein KKC76_19810 [Proteobacteria bacterium]|nr:hypothetical protein [Pseudomonadota bacterium]MBU4296460.1 hypothetical protein [Pseudomonadota bacterium]MCG2749231.1 hypothetical protein [Desulfobulbaceae bacterium]